MGTILHRYWELTHKEEQNSAKSLPHSFMEELFGDHSPYEQCVELKEHNSQNAKSYFVNLDDVVNSPQ